MSNDKLFGDDPAPNNTTPDPGENTNYMEELVGEGKKYASVDDALKALHHAQQHIPRVEAEAQGVRDELKSRLALEDLVDKLQKAQAEAGVSNPGEPPQNEQPNEQATPPVPPATGLTKEELEALVQRTLVQDKEQSSFNTNVDTVASELQAKWGPGYRSMMAEKAQELGMSQEDLLALAGKSPKAFYNTVGVSTAPAQATNPHAPPTSQGRPASPNSNARTWDYYTNLRRENPSLYWSKETQNEIFKGVEAGTLNPT